MKTCWRDWGQENRVSQEIENLVEEILLSKGFAIKFYHKSARYWITTKVNRKNRVVGRFRKDNLIRGLCDEIMIRGHQDSDITCGWCRDFDPRDDAVKFETIRGPVPHMTAEDRMALMIARLSN